MRHGRRSIYLAWCTTLASFCSPLGAYGSHQWAHMIGWGSVDYHPSSVDATADGGFVIAGYTSSSGLPTDAWIAKLSAAGTISWQKIFGGADGDYAEAVRQTADGGYILGGYTESFGNGSEGWALKLDASGSVVWQKTYGGTGDDVILSLEQTGDGGYIFAGRTTSFGAADSNAWTVKLSATGTVEWEKRRATNQAIDLAYSIKAIAGGVYAMVGIAEGNAGSWDIWFLRINPTGTATDRHIIGSSKNDLGKAIDAAGDGGWFVSGYFDSGAGTGYDGLLLKLNSSRSHRRCLEAVWGSHPGGQGRTSGPQDLAEKTESTTTPSITDRVEEDSR
ncbi:MAG: hypothetical protein HYX75_16525 [Acidobacteria bacterium]|nr:hypothetical protein [Acidobacteriota bacterium]